jgi:hypothetical protein
MRASHTLDTICHGARDNEGVGAAAREDGRQGVNLVRGGFVKVLTAKGSGLRLRMPGGLNLDETAVGSDGWDQVDGQAVVADELSEGCERGDLGGGHGIDVHSHPGALGGMDRERPGAAEETSSKGVGDGAKGWGNADKGAIGVRGHGGVVLPLSRGAVAEPAAKGHKAGDVACANERVKFGHAFNMSLQALAHAGGGGSAKGDADEASIALERGALDLRFHLGADGIGAKKLRDVAVNFVGEEGEVTKAGISRGFLAGVVGVHFECRSEA